VNCPYRPLPVPTTEATVTITLPGRPVPPADLHTAAVDVTHAVVTQTVPPTCAVGEGELTPKFIPWRVSPPDPEVGPFCGWICVSVGASYEKAEAKVPSSRKVPSSQSMATRIARPLPMPLAKVHRIELIVVHDVVTQTVSPTCAVGVRDSAPKPIPWRISRPNPFHPEAGAFGGWICVSAGASYEKAAAKVPSSRSMAARTTTLLRAAGAPAEARRSAPAGSMYAIDVVDIQLLVVHTLNPTNIVGDVSTEPKLTPDMVIEEPPVAGALATYGDVSTGASYVNVCPYQPLPVPITEATVTTTLPGRPVPPADLHTAAVDVTHAVVTQTVPPTCVVGDASSEPKLTPDMVMVEPLVAGALATYNDVSTGAS
jgi:hypothetical protein